MGCNNGIFKTLAKIFFWENKGGSWDGESNQPLFSSMKVEIFKIPLDIRNRTGLSEPVD